MFFDFHDVYLNYRGKGGQPYIMQDFIETSLDYIEQNLKTDITADELAEMANYSAGHFNRLFVHATDSTIACYILKRRLDHALAEIATGRKAIGVVLEYGFDTYAGFYKAIVKMYGCSPKKYLSIYKIKSRRCYLCTVSTKSRKYSVIGIYHQS